MRFSISRGVYRVLVVNNCKITNIFRSLVPIALKKFSFEPDYIRKLLTHKPPRSVRRAAQKKILKKIHKIGFFDFILELVTPLAKMNGTNFVRIMTCYPTVYRSFRSDTKYSRYSVFLFSRFLGPPGYAPGGIFCRSGLFCS